MTSVTRKTNTQATILCVDDDPHVLQALNRVLGKRYHILQAESGIQALRLLRDQEVHILITDQRMPEMTGLDLLRQVRQAYPQVVRLLLTGYADLNAVVGSINEGEVFRLLNKPWSNEALLATLARAESLAANLSRPLPESTHNPATPVALLRCAACNGASLLPDAVTLERYPTYRASNPEEILSQLGTYPEIGVLLVEFSQQTEMDESWVQFLGRLKRAKPTLVTLVVSNILDFNFLAQLINQAQVFRYLSMPCSEERLQSALASALEQHLWLAQHPDSIYVSEDSQEIPTITVADIQQAQVASGVTLRGWWAWWRKLWYGV